MNPFRPLDIYGARLGGGISERALNQIVANCPAAISAHALIAIVRVKTGAVIDLQKAQQLLD